MTTTLLFILTERNRSQLRWPDTIKLKRVAWTQASRKIKTDMVMEIYVREILEQMEYKHLTNDIEKIVG